MSSSTPSSTGAKLSFSFKAKPKPVNVGLPPQIKPTAFGSLDDDAHEPVSSLIGSKKTVAQHTATSRSVKKKMEEEKKVDQTVYEYDEVWDRMKDAERKVKAAKETHKETGPKYIGALLASAATRKLDYVRAEEKMIQREREAEGDEFSEKESFVTQAYKDQMAEIRLAEEEEKAREAQEQNQKKTGLGSGLAHMYRSLLDKSEEAHTAAVAATDQRQHGPTPNLTISRPPETKALSDIERARMARLEGKSVEVNEDNQIVDKRELLSAGLNLSAPNSRRPGGKGMAAFSNPKTQQDVAVHTAVGTAASRAEINERRAREVAEQMEQEQEKMRVQKEQAEKEERERIMARRNDEGSVKSARERYLERKRRKLEDGTPMDTGT